MYSRIPTLTSTENFSEGLERLSEVIEKTTSIVIGAGAGLSAAAGFVYSGHRFRKYFQDFADNYGFEDMYTGGFYPYETQEEYWGYWSRYITVNRYMDPPEKVYDSLLELVKDKDYFVLTTNVDHCFQKAGFDKVRLFYTQGDYGLWQCSRPCTQQTYDNEAPVADMWAQQKNRRIPSALIPHCPVCGAPMVMNLRADERFVEDIGWHLAANRYRKFIDRHRQQPVLYLELGVGMNTPGIIKYPFWQLTVQNPDAFYAVINSRKTYIPSEISKRSLFIEKDIKEALCQIQRIIADEKR